MINFLSGEFFLKWRPNGGTVVFQRSAWIATLGYLATIAVREALDPRSSCVFSASSARLALLNNLPAAAAILAAAYAALYARFASQWTYLAGVYNQIMASKVRGLPKEAPEKSALDAWEAGFIEDAEDLHLARKPMFAGVIISMLERESVREKFITATAGGAARVAELEAVVKEAYSRAEQDRQKRRAKKRK